MEAPVDMFGIGLPGSCHDLTQPLSRFGIVGG